MTIFKRMVFALLGLLGLVVVVLLVSRLWPASALQKQARAALEQPLDWPGANAWALLETLEHDGLDMAQRQALVDERVRRFAAWKQENIASWDAQADLQGRPPVPLLGGEVVHRERSEVLCASQQAAHCLDKVRQNPAAVATELAARGSVLQRVAQLADYGHVRTPYVADVSTPYLPALGRLFDPLAAHALAHVQGSSVQAMEGLCRDMETGRMLLTRSDSLINAMVGNALLQANGQLLGQVLAELPANQALPERCTVALEPLPSQDLGLCRAMRGEYAMSRAAISDSYQQEMGSTPGSSWLFNVDKSLYRMAAVHGQGCLPTVQQQVAQDLPVEPDMRAGSLWKMECPANAIGCILSSVAGPAYAAYSNRAQDVAAQQRLLATLVWLRAQPALEPAAIPEHLQKLPTGLVSAQRPITLSTDGRALQVSPRYYRNGTEADHPLRVPLPHAWWPPLPTDPAP